MIKEISELYSGFNKIIELESNFRSCGVFTKKVTLDYVAESCDDWILFNNDDPKKSFAFHDLEVGLAEATYWRRIAQSGKPITLDGYVSRIHNGSLGGYLEVPEEYHRTGIKVRDGRLKLVATDEVIDEIYSGLANLFVPALMNYMDVNGYRSPSEIKG